MNPYDDDDQACQMTGEVVPRPWVTEPKPYGPEPRPADYCDLATLLDQARAHPRRRSLRPPVPAEVLDATVYSLAYLVAARKSDWCLGIVKTYLDYPQLHVRVRDFTDGLFVEWYESIRLEDGSAASDATRERGQTQVVQALRLVAGAWALPENVDGEIRRVLGEGRGLRRHRAHLAAVENSVLDLFGQGGQGERDDS